MNEKYTMRLDLRVLQHLGIRLYSNVAAVISELVANSYDADANKVKITYDSDADRLIIADDGTGMSVAEINQRFLKVGYEKRKEEGGQSATYNRPFMGRKGIGKLSVFSVAEVVQVHTVNGSQKNALEIRLDDLETAIRSNGEYHPKEIKFSSEVGSKGTTLILSNLVKKRAAITVAALRKRLARRFAVIGRKVIGPGSFDVEINGKLVGDEDRDDLRSLQFVWEFGPKEVLRSSAMPGLAERFLIKNNKIKHHASWTVAGWFGTAAKPADLELEEAGSLKNIVVLARGRLIQESILDKLGFNRIFGAYVTGQIEADFLDDDALEDIATSDRQRLVEDDPRVIALRDFMREALLQASEDWADVRKKKNAADAELHNPALGGWIQSLPKAQQASARSVIGLIEGLPLDKDHEDDRRELFRSGVIAFERLRLKEASHNLERLNSLDPDHLLPLLVTQDNYESSLYGDIVRSRVQAIQQFKNLTNSKAKEVVLQKHLFDHLWLLDTGWERANGSPSIEHNLKRDFPKVFGEKLTDKESKGRIDIKYRTNAGVHLIVELKKYERVLKLAELDEQGQRYVSTLTKLLKNKGEINPKIQVIFVLGKTPKAGVDEGLPADFIEKSLGLWNARVAYYDQLIDSALNAYGEYLDAHEKVDSVEKVLKALGGAPSKLVSGPPAKQVKNRKPGSAVGPKPKNGAKVLKTFKAPKAAGVKPAGKPARKKAVKK